MARAHRWYRGAGAARAREAEEEEKAEAEATKHERECRRERMEGYTRKREQMRRQRERRDWANFKVGERMRRIRHKLIPSFAVSLSRSQNMTHAQIIKIKTHACLCPCLCRCSDNIISYHVDTRAQITRYVLTFAHEYLSRVDP